MENTNPLTSPIQKLNSEIEELTGKLQLLKMAELGIHQYKRIIENRNSSAHETLLTYTPPALQNDLLFNLITISRVVHSEEVEAFEKMLRECRFNIQLTGDRLLDLEYERYVLMS